MEPNVELESMIAEYVIPAEREEWLRTPLPAFQGRTPQQMIDAGQSQELIAEFWRLQEGQPL